MFVIVVVVVVVTHVACLSVGCVTHVVYQALLLVTYGAYLAFPGACSGTYRPPAPCWPPPQASAARPLAVLPATPSTTRQDTSPSKCHFGPTLRR